MTLYENIKHYAKMRGTSISQLERDLGWTKGSIGKWDVNRPSIDKAMTIARELKVSVEDIYGEPC